MLNLGNQNRRNQRGPIILKIPFFFIREMFEAGKNFMPKITSEDSPLEA
jgi:hypothetical protein